MAALHRGKRTLGRQALRYLFSALLCLALVFAYIVMMARGTIALYADCPFHVLPVFWLGGFVYYRRKYKIFRAGASGEAALLKALRRLPDRYHVFTNFVMRPDGRWDEADFIVVGENGVFVIEGKHHVGRIVGAADDMVWKQYKVGRRGKPYVKAMANPVEQLNRHAANVKRLLRRRGLRVATHGVLVFTNPRATLDIRPGGFPVLLGCRQVSAFILGVKAQNKLSKATIQEVAACLTESNS